MTLEKAKEILHREFGGIVRTESADPPPPFKSLGGSQFKAILRNGDPVFLEDLGNGKALLRYNFRYPAGCTDEIVNY